MKKNLRSTLKISLEHDVRTALIEFNGLPYRARNFPTRDTACPEPTHVFSISPFGPRR